MDFITAKDDGGCGDNWSYNMCKAPVKSSPPTNQNPAVYRPDAPPSCHPTNSVTPLKEEKYDIPQTCTPSSSGDLQYAKGSSVPWGRIAKPLVSPLIPVPRTASTSNY